MMRLKVATKSLKKFFDDFWHDGGKLLRMSDLSLEICQPNFLRLGWVANKNDYIVCGFESMK